jgi:hypothetical protein
MSKNFTRIIFDSLKTIFLRDNRYEINNSVQTRIAGSLLVLGSLPHGIYALGTKKTEQSRIVKKYKIVRNGFTDFMVIDEHGNHYNVNNSFWFWKWDSIEDWYNIKNGDELHFKYYGWRVPVLGMFPNIYFTHNIKH